MCVVAATVGAVAGGVGAAASGINALAGGGGGGGNAAPSGAQAVYNPQSLGQTMTGILSGGLSAGLGISGLAGENYNQLQAGAAAANPFGQYASGFVSPLQQMLQGGLQGTIGADIGGLSQIWNSITPTANIGTNIAALTGASNISTPVPTSWAQNMVNNPLTGVQLPQNIQSIIGANPYSFTQGEQFQYQQGLGALQSTQAAQGLIGSGKQAVDLMQYGQNYASQATQQNIQNLFGAQNIANIMGQNQFGNNIALANLMSGQQQNTFGNLLGIQQLQSTQQQNTQQNLGNLLSQALGINMLDINARSGLLNPLLTASQASLSSPATAGGILANLGVANQGSAGNITSGVGGLASGLGNLLGGLNFGGGGSYTGDFSTGGGFTTPGSYDSTLFGPTGYGGGYNYGGGGNSYGFTMPGV